MIEERHAALNRCRHAHVVLLHKKLNQVGFDVGVEQSLQQLSRRLFPVSEDIMVGSAGTEFGGDVLGQQFALIFLAERGKEVVEVKRDPRFPIEAKKSMRELAAGGGVNPRRSCDGVADTAPDRAREK